MKIIHKPIISVDEHGNHLTPSSVKFNFEAIYKLFRTKEDVRATKISCRT